MEPREYITYKAMIECEEGSAPGLFTPSYNQTVKINSCKVSTAMDKIPLTNIPNFVVCKKTQKPCVPVPTVWEDTYAVKVKGQQTLIGKSCIKCVAGGKIKFQTSGQVPLSPEEEEQLNGMRDDVKKAYDKEQEEKNKPWWKKAGEFIVDCVPVVGPIVSMAKNISEGNWGMALLDVGFLALDVGSLVAAPFTGGASVVGATALKMGARQAIKAGVKQVAKKMSKEAMEAAAKQAMETAGKVAMRAKKVQLCVFACFPVGTPVGVDGGTRNIEDMRPGDELWAWNGATGERALKKISRIVESESDMLIQLRIGQDVIETTPTHPFYSDGEWVDAGALEAGDRVMLFDGSNAIVEAVDFVIESDDFEGGEIDFSQPGAPNENVVLDSRKKIKVYTFEVEDFETFFVGNSLILVHNARICLKELSEQAIKKIRTEMLEAGYRPKYRKGQVQKVWDEALKKGKGKVRCPNTKKVLKWDKSKNRFDQWHMGHKPDKKWSDTVKDYKDGKITWKELLDKHGDHKNYVPEDPVGNMSHAYE